MDRERKSGWLLGLMTATLVAVIALGALYINRVAERFVEESERRDCATLSADISALEQAGQLTEAGSRLTLARRTRYAQIGCEPHLAPPTFVIVSPQQPQPTRSPS